MARAVPMRNGSFFDSEREIRNGLPEGGEVAAVKVPGGLLVHNASLFWQLKQDYGGDKVALVKKDDVQRRLVCNKGLGINFSAPFFFFVFSLTFFIGVLQYKQQYETSNTTEKFVITIIAFITTSTGGLFCM